MVLCERGSDNLSQSSEIRCIIYLRDLSFLSLDFLATLIFFLPNTSSRKPLLIPNRSVEENEYFLHSSVCIFSVITEEERLKRMLLTTWFPSNFHSDDDCVTDIIDGQWIREKYSFLEPWLVNIEKRKNLGEYND